MCDDEFVNKAESIEAILGNFQQLQLIYHRNEKSDCFMPLLYNI